MARVFVGMVLSLTLGTHYMGRRFLYSDLNSSAYLGTVKCIKTHVQNQINSGEEGGGGGGSSFSPSAETGDGSTSFPSCIG